MKAERKYITTKDWIAFFISTFLIFLSSLLLVISGVIFHFLHLVKKRPVLVCASVFFLILLYIVIQWTVVPITWRAKTDSVSVIVRDGDSMSRIVQRLKDANLIEEGTGFLIITKFLGKDRHIRAGKYDFKKRITLYSLFNQLIQGNVILKDVTIPEGFTFKEIAGILKRELQIDSLNFVRMAESSQVARSMNLPVSGLEGYLFPNTYKLTWGMSPEKVARLMVEQFQRTFNDSLLKRAEEINFSMAKVVILASMIEAEAKDGKEREIISAIFHNRLKRGMLLESCPTVTYGLPHIDRPLSITELRRDSPYNTYKYSGLPPGPICNPGKASILAALYPAPVDYLYFVAKGDGTHIFSTTLEEHNRAKNKIKQAQKNQT
jgi:UPF0755 protein